MTGRRRESRTRRAAAIAALAAGICAGPVGAQEPAADRLPAERPAREAPAPATPRPPPPEADATPAEADATPPEPGRDVGAVLAIRDAVSAARIEADVRTLAGFGTRHTLSDTLSDERGIGAARRWIHVELERISTGCGGCLDVRWQRTLEGPSERLPRPVEIVNVFAVQRGTLDPERVVLMSGDIDSRASDVLDAESDAPGANDNATGVAGVLEAARVLSKHRFDATVVYATLSGEEQGLYGGRHLAALATEEGWRVEAVLNNDMIGNVRGIDGAIDNTTVRVFSEGTRAVETEREARLRRFTGGEVDSPSRNLARYVDRMADLWFPLLDVMMVYRLDRFGRGGHHRPFNEAGYPAVRIMETHEHYDRQHQDVRTEGGRAYGDVVAGVDFDYAASITALNAVTLASLAWAPAPPAEVSIRGAVSPHTTLTWTQPPGPGVAGYRIHWRLTTSPTWDRSLWVGPVATHTLRDLVIDNWFFGVSAVSARGFESPVVFPGPAGAFFPEDPAKRETVRGDSLSGAGAAGGDRPGAGSRFRKQPDGSTGDRSGGAG